jgi:hypothetical protein
VWVLTHSLPAPSNAMRGEPIWVVSDPGLPVDLFGGGGCSDGGGGGGDAQSAKQFELVVPDHCRVKWTRSQYTHYETTHVEKLKVRQTLHHPATQIFRVSLRAADPDDARVTAGR